MFQTSRVLSARVACGLLGLCLALGPALPVWADAAGSYRAALEAIEARDWPAVVRHLEAALTEQPREKRRVRLHGIVFVEYLPHFHLGRAYLELGDCDRALRELEVSRQQGIIQKTNLFGELERYRQRCEEILTRASLPPPPPPPPAADPAVTGLLGAPGTSPTAEPPPAEPTLEERPLEEIPPPEPPVTPAPEEPPQESPAEPSEPTESPVPTESPEPTEPPQETTPQQVPTALRGAVEAYFAGRYQQALDRLTRLRSIDPDVLAQAKLFEAAAHFSLHRRSGEENSDHLDAARAAARACRRLDRDLNPPPTVFSPAFLDLFRAAAR